MLQGGWSQARMGDRCCARMKLCIRHWLDKPVIGMLKVTNPKRMIWNGSEEY